MSVYKMGLALLMNFSVWTFNLFVVMSYWTKIWPEYERFQNGPGIIDEFFSLDLMHYVPLR